MNQSDYHSLIPASCVWRHWIILHSERRTVPLSGLWALGIAVGWLSTPNGTLRPLVSGPVPTPARAPYTVVWPVFTMGGGAGRGGGPLVGRGSDPTSLVSSPTVTGRGTGRVRTR